MAEQADKHPRDVEYRAEYEPDMARMVKALRILLEYNPALKELKEEKDDIQVCANEKETLQIAG